jgi:hypothetical protein
MYQGLVDDRKQMNKYAAAFKEGSRGDVMEIQDLRANRLCF